jgi:type I restriction enzyme S subunit
MNTTWNTGRLGDVCRVVPGYAFKSSDWRKTGIRVVKIKNIISDNSVDLANSDCVAESLLTPRLQKFAIGDGDILIAMTGATAGKVGRVRTNQRLLLNQRVAKIAPVEADSNFIWAIVSSHEYQERFFYLADGAAQPNMSGSQIEGIEIPLPPLPIQRRIAGILSAYDDLIENNQRRIKILEEMARRLYREWFVHFRFPGHESCRLVESPLGEIPEGWEVKLLPDCVAINPRVQVPREGIKPFVPMGCLSSDSMLITDIESREGNSGSKFQNGDTLFA